MRLVFALLVLPCLACAASSSTTQDSGEPQSTTGGSQTGGTDPNAPSGTTGGAGTTTAGDANGAVDPNCSIRSANSQGVGTPCADDSACAHLAANTCSQAFYAAWAPFCTMQCAAQATCGDGASCMPAPDNNQAYGCIPDACIPAGTARNPSPPPLSACLPPNGTAYGVGKPCTRGGRQCGGMASVCTADVLANPPLSMCTIVLCSGDAQCGPDARCVAAPGSSTLKACTPTACLP